jgi:hypothetical protein
VKKTNDAGAVAEIEDVLEKTARRAEKAAEKDVEEKAA